LNNLYYFDILDNLYLYLTQKVIMQFCEAQKPLIEQYLLKLLESQLFHNIPNSLLLKIFGVNINVIILVLLKDKVNKYTFCSP
jgi:ABC-type sulfate transport system permease subunit